MRKSTVEEASAANADIPTRKRPRKRVNTMALAGGVVLIVLGSLSAWAVTNHFSNSTEVVSVTTDLHRGDEITAKDLATFPVAEGQSNSFVPASQIQDLVGQRALMDLPQGALVTEGTIGGDLTPPAGYTVVGLSLAPGQLPAQPLTAGDKVRIVDTPGAQADLTVDTAPLATTAQVLSQGTTDQSGRQLVDVLVSTDDAPTLAARASTEQIALVLDSAADAGDES